MKTIKILATIITTMGLMGCGVETTVTELKSKPSKNPDTSTPDNSNPSQPVVSAPTVGIEATTCTPSPAPVLEGNLYFEIGRPSTLIYNSTNVGWYILMPDGEQLFNGSPLTLTINELGSYPGTVWGFDNCRNRVSQNFTINVIPALTNPSITINNGDPRTFTASVSLQLHAENATEMMLSYSNDCSVGEWQPYAESATWQLRAEGTNVQTSVKYRSLAAESACVSDGILYDITAPVVSFVKVPESNSYSSSASFEFSATDAVTGVTSFECALDSAAFNECELKKDFSNLTYGQHHVQIRATDGAGNTSAVSSFEWEYLNTAPVVTITDGPADMMDTRLAQFAFTGSDDHRVTRFECSLDNASFENCVSPHLYRDLANGTHSFSVRGFDDMNLGSNVASRTWRVNVPVIDPPPVDPPPVDPPPAVAPVVQLIETPDKSTTDVNARFVFTANDENGNLAGYKCQLDLMAETECLTQITYQNLAVGEHHFAVYAYDLDGLKSNTAEYSWQIIRNRIPNTDSFTIDSSGDKIDILVVVDNSASMIEEQKKMASRFSTFIGRLDGLDWQLGIITTDAHNGEKPYKDGRLLMFKNSDNLYSINSKTPEAAKLFANTIVRKEIGSSDEEGVRALHKAFHRPDNRFFFRDRAHLASVIISDEDEKSHGKNLKENNIPENLVSTFKSLFPNNTYTNHSIILSEETEKHNDDHGHQQNGGNGHSNHSASNNTYSGNYLFMPGYNFISFSHDSKKNCECAQVGASAYGATYAHLSKITGGVIGNICAPDYGDILKGIGDNIKSESFTASLKCTPVGEMKVKLNGMEISAGSFNMNGNQLSLKSYPPVGTKVEVTYYCD